MTGPAEPSKSSFTPDLIRKAVTTVSNYSRPGSLVEALAALADGGSSSRMIVGGTDLLVGMRHQLFHPELIVDLKHISDLPAPIVVDDDAVLVGPTLTMAELVEHAVVNEWFPGLVDAATSVGSLAIRNRASLIGNLCNGSPAADTAPSLLVLDARVSILSSTGERVVDVTDFLIGPRKTLCSAGEIVTEVWLPRPPAGSATSSLRLTRRRGVDIATISVAANVRADGTFVLGLGAVGPKALLTDRSGPVDLTDQSAVAVELDRLLAIATPISDVRSSAEYRVATLRALARRAVLVAAGRRNTRKMAS